MFDFAWTEIVLIGVVALIAIGPKDMPVALKTLAGLIKKARRMAGEFQSHVDEMVKDTELADVRNQISELRSFDLRGEVKRTLDPDGSLRAAVAEDPFRGTSGNPLTNQGSVAPDHLMTETVVAERGSVSFTPLEGDAVARDAAPAFIPPAASPAAASAAAASPEAVPEPPAFIPPGVVARGPHPDAPTS